MQGRREEKGAKRGEEEGDLIKLRLQSIRLLVSSSLIPPSFLSFNALSPSRLASHTLAPSQAPPGNRVSVRFLGFEFAPRYEKPGSKVNGKCYHETVEIRLSADAYDGDHYCGSDIAPGTVMTSDGSSAVIMVMADEKMLGQGLRADVSFFDPLAPVTVTQAPVTAAPEVATDAPPERVTITRIKPVTGGGTGGRVKPLPPRPPHPPTTIVVPLPDNDFESQWRKIIESWGKDRVVMPLPKTRRPTGGVLPPPDWVRVVG